MSESGDSLGELKVSVSVDLDMAAAHAQQAKVAADAVATQADAAHQVESMWAAAAKMRGQPGGGLGGDADADAAQAVDVWAQAATKVKENNLAAQATARQELLKRGVNPATISDPVAHLKGVKDAESAAKKIADANKKAAADSKKAHEEAAKKTAATWTEAAKYVRTSLAAGFAAGAAAVGVFMHSTLESGLAIDRQARSIGMSTDEVQRWRYVAEQAGLEGDSLGEAVGGFAQRAADAAQNGGDAAKRFRDMGISLKDANGEVRPLNALMLDAADGLQRMGPGTEQTAAAMALFGEKGRLLLPVLGQGRAGVAALTDEFDALGGGLDSETIDRMAEFDRETNRIKVSLMAALMPAVREMLELMRKFADKIRPLITGFQDMAANSHLVRAGLITLGATGVAVGAAMLAAWWEVIVGMLIVVATAVLIGLAIDDVWTTLEGGDSVLKQMLTGMLGLRGANAVIETLRDTFLGLGAAIDLVLGMLGILDRDAQMHDTVEGARQSIENARVAAMAPEDRAAYLAQTAGSASFASRAAGSGDRLLTGSPQQAAAGFRFDVANGAGMGAITMANNSRVQVQIDGVVDPTSTLFKTHVENAVRTVMDDNTQTTLEHVTKSRPR